MENSLSKEFYIQPAKTKSIFNIAQTFLSIRFSTFILISVALINISFVILIISSLFIKTSFEDLTYVLSNYETFQAIYITLSSVLISVLATAIFGTPLAFFLSRKNTPFFKIIDIISALPIVIPPSIAGLCLLITFGRNGILGNYFNYFNINIAFSFWALVIAQVFITMPIYVQLMKNAFKSIDTNIEEAAIICGAGDKELLFSIYLPITIKSLITAIILCILRAAGEFGASIMFAGNLSGKTQSLTIAIYTLTQENIYFATALAIIMILVFILPLGAFKLLTK